MRSALLACVLAYATAYTAQDVRRRAVTSPHVSLFVHVESPEEAKKAALEHLHR